MQQIKIYNMKKAILLSLSLVFAGIVANAQNDPFFEKVNFVGAMGTSDWSKPWANFRPDTVNYPNVTTEVTEDIVTDTKWTADKVYHLTKIIYVKNGATITIEPGTVIRGANSGNTTSSAAGSLIITRGAKIYAVGTPDKPIVFTSDKAKGLRATGNWGGIVIYGKATQNVPTKLVNAGTPDEYKETFFEVFPASSLENYHGGNNDNDSSGVMRFVRVEFGGWYSELNKEINGFTFGSVGRKTRLDYLQASFTNDDSYEWFGGTVNHKFLIAYAGMDDDFDTDQGYRGKLQFLVGLRNPTASDYLNTTGGSSRGFESDNNTDNITVAGNINPLPITAPIFCNVTLQGPIPNEGNAKLNLPLNNKFSFGSINRTNSSLSCFNSIIVGYPIGVVQQHSDKTNPKSTYSKAQADSISFRNIVLSNNDRAVGVMNNYPTSLNPVYNLSNWFATPSFQNDTLNYPVESMLMLENPYPYSTETAVTANNVKIVSSPDFRLKSASPLLTAASFTHPKISNTLPLAIEDLEIVEIKQVVLFPNPANSSVEIALSTSFANGIVTVQNSLGNIVLNINAIGNSARFDVSNFASGIYIVSVNNGGKVINKTLVINK